MTRKTPVVAAAPTGLNWRPATHWNRTAKPCRHCGGRTHLRDEDRVPSHKVCAEKVAGFDITPTTR